MPLDVDAIAAQQALELLKEILSNQPHMQREELADDYIEFAEKMKEKYNYE
jgi:hypothetical protein